MCKHNHLYHKPQRKTLWKRQTKIIYNNYPAGPCTETSILIIRNPARINTHTGNSFSDITENVPFTITDETYISPLDGKKYGSYTTYSAWVEIKTKTITVVNDMCDNLHTVCDTYPPNQDAYLYVSSTGVGSGCYGAPIDPTEIILPPYPATQQCYSVGRSQRSDYEECCCCGGGSPCNVNCPPDEPPPISTILVKRGISSTEYEINPYLMMDGDSRYFTDASTPDWTKFISHISSGVWKNDRRSIDPEIDNYKLFTRNPNCGRFPLYFGYFMWNKNKTAKDRINVGCKTKEFSNPTGFDSSSSTCSFPNSVCYTSPRKHISTNNKADLIQKSWDIHGITAPPCWKQILLKHPLITGISGMSGNQGITFYSLTDIIIDDCSNLELTEFIRNRLKDYTFPQPIFSFDA